MANPVVRKAKLKDAVAMKRCIDAAYARYVGKIDHLPAFSEGIEQDIVESQSFVLENDGEVAGILIMVALTNKQAIKLVNVAVQPDQGGQGFGRMLIDFAVDHARQMGCCEIVLNTHAQMTDNIGLYQHLGWRIVDQSGATVSMTREI